MRMLLNDDDGWWWWWWWLGKIWWGEHEADNDYNVADDDGELDKDVDNTVYVLLYICMCIRMYFNFPEKQTT